MTTEKRDYSKLRPFDLEAFKAGEKALFIVGTDTPEVRTYAAGPDKDGRICVSNQYSAFQFMFCTFEDYRMAPLAWVRKSADDDTLWPVYKGDVLYRPGINPGPVVADKIVNSCGTDYLYFEGNGGSDYADNRNGTMTFTPPKVKREGWVVIEKSNEPTAKLHPKGAVALKFLYVSEEAARKSNPRALTIARIEWPEPAGQEGCAA